METQKLALTKLAASTWGITMKWARTVYTAAIRSAMVYGYSAWHRPAEAGAKAGRGLAPSLAATQSQCLRAISGAYRATPTRSLEAETYIPPIDLYLSKRLADFETDLANSPVAELIRTTSATLSRRLRNRRRPGRRPRTTSPAPPDPDSGRAKAAWARTWLPARPPQCPPEDWTPRKASAVALHREWAERWQADLDKANRRQRTFEPADASRPSKAACTKHRGLPKHLSAVITQMRTGKIGLQSFLFTRRVPGVLSPICPCGRGRETPYHVIAKCPIEEPRRARLRQAIGGRVIRTRRDFFQLTEHRDTAPALAKWLLGSGRLPEYRLAVAIAEDDREDTERAGTLASAGNAR